MHKWKSNVNGKSLAFMVIHRIFFSLQSTKKNLFNICCCFMKFQEEKSIEKFMILWCSFLYMIEYALIILTEVFLFLAVPTIIRIFEEYSYEEGAFNSFKGCGNIRRIPIMFEYCQKGKI